MKHAESRLPDPRPDRAPAGELGRRVAMRREELGLSRQEVADRAGSAPGYLQYIEEQQSTPGIGFLLRLAEALETTVADLTCCTTDLPPGLVHPGLRARLIELDAQECHRLLHGHGVGRIGVTTVDGPVIVPVSYVMDGDRIACRSAQESLPVAPGEPVAFEADHIDEALSRGWSVLVVGTAAVVDDAEAARRLDALACPTPWTAGPRSTWLAVTPTHITGRRVHVLDDHASAASHRPAATRG